MQTTFQYLKGGSFTEILVHNSKAIEIRRIDAACSLIIHAGSECFFLQSSLHSDPFGQVDISA